MTNKKTKEPLLYIEQPTFDKPVVFMQDNYSSLIRDETDYDQEVIEEDYRQIDKDQTNPFLAVLQKGPIDSEVDEFEIEELEDEVDETSDELDDEQEEEQTHNKTFNDLTIQGKIDYFTSLPAEMPKVKSEVVLEEDVYRGYILQDDGKEIVIQVGRIEETVNKADIKDIILIGF